MMWHPVLRSRGLTSSAAILVLRSSRLPAEEVNAKSKPIFVTSGQEITPTAAPGSLLQYLKPGLADFPNYLASVEDHLGNVEKFNRIVWQGLKGAAPYPVQRTGVDLRQNRPPLLLRAAAALTSAGS